MTQVKITLPVPRVAVVPWDGGWVAYKSGDNLDLDTVPVWPTKKEAIKIGKEMARQMKCPLYIHKKNGMVQHKIIYK